jgi:hypothetical protein
VKKRFAGKRVPTYTVMPQARQRLLKIFACIG